MIQYTEFIKGKKQYAEAIQNYKAIKEQFGGLKPHIFYPIVAVRDDDDVFPTAEVGQLRKEDVLVCITPGKDPELMTLYVEGDWAYEIIATDGQAE